jgi:hypothetical protein
MAYFSITATKMSNRVLGKLYETNLKSQTSISWYFNIILSCQKLSDKIFYSCVSPMHAVSSASLNGSNALSINYTLVATDITLA